MYENNNKSGLYNIFEYKTAFLNKFIFHNSSKNSSDKINKESSNKKLMYR